MFLTVAVHDVNYMCEKILMLINGAVIQSTTKKNHIFHLEQKAKFLLHKYE